MQETQQGFWLHEWGGELRYEERPVPRPRAGEVLVEVEACGVGLTVVNAIHGELADDPALLPVVPGHELAGRVVGLGPGVDTALTGRRVVAYFYLVCGTCVQCRSGREARCTQLAGVLGLNRDGGYAPYVVVPAANAIPVPDELDPVAATVVADAIATPLHLCRARRTPRPDDRVLVIGAGGGVGIHMAQLARLYGARTAGMDLSEEKLAKLEQLGVTAVRSGPFSQMDAGEIWPDGPPTVVVDFVGSEESLEWGAGQLAPDGTLVVVTPFRDRTLRLDSLSLVLGERTVMGSRYAGRAELTFAAELVAAGRIEAVVGETVGPDGLPGMLRQLRENTLLGRGALSWARS